jgi:hypothetical protein
MLLDRLVDVLNRNCNSMTGFDFRPGPQRKRHRSAQAHVQIPSLSSGVFRSGIDSTVSGDCVDLSKDLIHGVCRFLASCRPKMDLGLRQSLSCALTQVKRIRKILRIQLSKKAAFPMGSWRKAWRLACQTAGVRYSLLQGTGRFMRHVKLGPETATNAAALSRLIDAAYSDIKARVENG